MHACSLVHMDFALKNLCIKILSIAKLSNPKRVPAPADCNANQTPRHSEQYWGSLCNVCRHFILIGTAILWSCLIPNQSISPSRSLLSTQTPAVTLQGLIRLQAFTFSSWGLTRDAGNWNWNLLHVKHMIHHWAAALPPTTGLADDSEEMGPKSPIEHRSWMGIWSQVSLLCHITPALRESIS